MSPGIRGSLPLRFCHALLCCAAFLASLPLRFLPQTQCLATLVPKPRCRCASASSCHAPNRAGLLNATALLPDPDILLCSLASRPRGRCRVLARNPGVRGPPQRRLCRYQPPTQAFWLLSGRHVSARSCRAALAAWPRCRCAAATSCSQPWLRLAPLPLRLRHVLSGCPGRLAIPPLRSRFCPNLPRNPGILASLPLRFCHARPKGLTS